MDLGRGELHIRSGSELVTLHGSPDQLLELRPGDQGEFRFASYGDEPWLAPTSSPRRPLRVPAAMRGRASGMLSRVDGARGMAWLVAQSGAERVLRAHPERLRALMPGLWVTVAYSRVAGADWMATVEVRSAARARP
ncbi:MAG: hypothetical protein HYZ28_18780 [Myxococcales bacterium]|nr:hypothetical protein [Myxococcales bacterium]